ncbi:hypothetical protein [Cohnella herbarum]|uniref:hypothetical protein n=1 Tax=Cohnella herbarum TaxID=2728023 RepID=UPI0020C39569|nr:hypothetical protein [Cohnella herbarum]
MFEIKNVTKQYNGEIALNDISFSIGKGLNFIVGASGSGKNDSSENRQRHGTRLRWRSLFLRQEH